MFIGGIFMSENQAENLSQEEIQKRLDLIKQNCIFCKIANKEVDSKIVFEDEKCIAFLDINPASKGHLVLAPKEHYMMMPMVPDEILGHLAFVVKSLCEILISSGYGEDVSTFIANGSAAGQMSQHFLMHIIPKPKDSQINFSVNSNKELSQIEIDAIKKELKAKLSNIKQ